MKKIFLFLTIILFVSFLVSPVSAAKKRVRRVASTEVVTSYSTAKLNRSTNGVDINFINLGNATKVSYELSYNANGINQGAMGSLIPSGSTDSRNLYFGTCSKGVCTPHSNITGATLTITTSLKSGGVNTKLYRIKI
jgi:hypothetical protein